jgi:hypothetical protein
MRPCVSARSEPHSGGACRGDACLSDLPASSKTHKKGGKGLGKDGAKRHRKVLRNNIQGIAKPANRRLACRGGVKRISRLVLRGASHSERDEFAHSVTVKFHVSWMQGTRGHGTILRCLLLLGLCTAFSPPPSSGACAAQRRQPAPCRVRLFAPPRLMMHGFTLMLVRGKCLDSSKTVRSNTLLCWQCRRHTHRRSLPVLRSSLPSHVYRTLRVESEEHRQTLNGGGLTPRDPHAECSVRDHVLRGSSSKWRGSQYISTTASLECAVFFAAPFNSIVKIDLEKFRESGGSVVDLRSTESFALHVPPDSDERGEEERVAVLQRADTAAGQPKRILRCSDSDHIQLHDEVVHRDAKFLYAQAAQSPWECARLFSVRSEEILLVGAVRSDCVQILPCTIVTTNISNLPLGSQIDVKDLNELRPLRPDGGSNSGRTLCKFGDTELVLKQAKPNLDPKRKDACAMRFAIDSEFAAFSVYRLIEEHCPQMGLGVQDCIKVTFDVSIDGFMASLGCLLFRPVRTLTPVRVGYQMMDAKVYDAISKAFPSPLPAMKRVTPDELVARWKDKADLHPFGESDERRFRERAAGIEMFAVMAHMVAPEFASRALEGVAVDILLANVYGWGVYNECQLSIDSASGKVVRLSADEALGNIATEHLNYDRREPEGNLLVQTLSSATGKLPYFNLPPPRFTTKETPETYQDQSGDLYARFAIRYTELLACIDEYPDAFNAALRGLSVPPDVHRLARLYPECAHLATLPADVLWHNYLRGRCLTLQYTAVSLSRAEAESTANRLEAPKLWEKIVSLASRLSGSVDLFSKVLGQRRDLTDEVADFQSRCIRTNAFVEPLLSFAYGAVSAVPLLIPSGDEPSDDWFASDSDIPDYLKCLAQGFQKGDPWASTLRSRPQLFKLSALHTLLEYTNANPKSQPAYAYYHSFGLKVVAHEELGRASDELVVYLLSEALLYDRRGATLLMGPVGAKTSEGYLVRITEAATRVLSRWPDSVEAKFVLAANDLSKNQAQLYSEIIEIIKQWPRSMMQLLYLSRVMEYFAEHAWTCDEEEDALRLWSGAFDLACRAETMGALPRGMRPSSELLYALGFCMVNFRRKVTPNQSHRNVPGEEMQRVQKPPALDDAILHEILPINLHRAQDCLTMYIKCAQVDSLKLSEAHYLLAFEAFLSIAEKGGSANAPVAEVLPHMKQHIADGDAALSRRPQLIAYSQDPPGIRNQVEAIVTMIELRVRMEGGAKGPSKAKRKGGGGKGFGSR